MTPEEAFGRYRDVLQSLNAETLDRLDDLIAPNICFKDPFHEVVGPEAMKAVFARLFSAAENIDFVIDDVACGEDYAYFRWTLDASLSNEPWHVTGVTRAQFDASGRVSDHVEYWDAASQLYERFPVMGSLLRYVRRRIAGP